VGLWVKRGTERERKQAPLALGATRPHTVGYIGGCGQEQGEIESRRAKKHLPFGAESPAGPDLSEARPAALG